MANYQINRFLEKQVVLNYSPRFVLLKGDVDVSELEEKVLGVRLGHGPVLSISKNRFAVNLNGQVISQGVDVFGRKGDRNSFEERVTTELFKLMLVKQNKEQVKQYLKENIDYLVKGDERALKEELILISVAKREWFQYRDRAHMLAKVKYQIREGIKKGQKISRGWVLGEEDEVDYKTFLEHSLDRERYYERMFGNDGTIYSIIRPYFRKDRGFLRSLRPLELQDLGPLFNQA
jgi:hypothetical protein